MPVLALATGRTAASLVGISDELKGFIADLLSRAAEGIEGMKRKAFTETNRYSEVQQEIAWFNDGLRDAAEYLRKMI